MVTVAIAGGTGHIGLTIAEVLKKNPNHRVIVLSRTVRAPDTQDNAAPVIATDYTNIDALAHLLETNAVHTIVSALSLKTPSGSAAELNLIAAASKSSTTKRFIASDWAAPIPSDPTLHLPQDTLRLSTIAALSHTSLEWTALHVGQIADYLGTPHLRSHMGVYALHIDMAHRSAAIPGTGDDEISFTYSGDIALFVEAVLDMPVWEREMSCYSDCCSLNDVVRVAEDATGTKFNVTHDSVDKLERGEMTELPSHRSLYPLMGKTAVQKRFATFGLLTVKGLLRLPEEGSLNRLFPHIKTMTVAEIVGAWRGK
ncbi:NAD(P)-binding protein [Coniochaeta ligniaria NRRL 30616]|uniref:NAD(P)-binding protein n=1 Tax=Coniochaeta ligniaria NRRL 30616 TaxID=1408157 RepID=A0A1J7J921_9PEZI|nr:NAD(P)-binding protein [Coniochaeta ligniaria NRRL 30616]